LFVETNDASKKGRHMVLSILFILIGAVILLLMAGRLYFNYKYRKKVNALFSNAHVISKKTFQYDRIKALPPPVQRYFKLVLIEGQPHISFVRLRHDGWFKTDLKKDWVAITGEQYFTTNPAGFIWKGQTNVFTAIDQYHNGKGSIAVSLFSLFKIVDGSGPNYDQGELLRWLGESAWFPTNLLPSKQLSWLPVDANTAILRFNELQLSLAYTVTFGKDGLIAQLETKRYMSDNALETWIGKVSDYKSVNNMLIPEEIEAIWKLEGNEYPYARFRIKDIQYEIREPY
jgi:hypothetical protein